MALAGQLRAYAAFKKMLIARLLADDGLVDVLAAHPNNAEQAYITDTVPDNWQTAEDSDAIFPFALIGHVAGQANDTDTGRGWVVEVEIVIISRYKGMAEVEDVIASIDAVIEAIETPMAAESYRLTLARSAGFDIERIASEKNLTTQGMITVQAFLQETDY